MYIPVSFYIEHTLSVCRIVHATEVVCDNPTAVLKSGGMEIRINGAMDSAALHCTYTQYCILGE